MNIGVSEWRPELLPLWIGGAFMIAWALWRVVDARGPSHPILLGTATALAFGLLGVIAGMVLGGSPGVAGGSATPGARDLVSILPGAASTGWFALRSVRRQLREGGEGVRSAWRVPRVAVALLCGHVLGTAATLAGFIGWSLWR